MDLTEAARRFQRGMRYCDDLIAVHRDSGGLDPGRRTRETSLNRAVIVLAVAAWQSVVQDLALTVVDLGELGVGTALTPAAYSVVAGRIRKEVGDFSTPNAENTRRLLQGVGFDPRPHWTWQQRGGQGVGMITLDPHDIDQRINGWLRLRHDIAHGHPELSRVGVLLSVRQTPNPPPDWAPTLRLVDAEQCVAFFRRLASVTGDALAVHVGTNTVSWKKA